jgi:hypothetical protein
MSARPPEATPKRIPGESWQDLDKTRSGDFQGPATAYSGIPARRKPSE